MLTKLLLANEARGRHATGIATCGGSNEFVWKWAETASVVVKHESYQLTLDKITDDTPVVIGHTRAAYVPAGSMKSNANQDEAAHPFKVGDVTGAHNGVIYNWQDVAARVEGGDGWIVDSQAALGLLNQHHDPAVALADLDGYFALTWWKRRGLYMARSTEAPLSCAYVHDIQTMFWSSLRAPLEDVLLRAGLKHREYDAWDIKHNAIYRFDPRKFTAHSTHRKVKDAAFVSRKQYNGVNTADPSKNRFETYRPAYDPPRRFSKTRQAELFRAVTKAERRPLKETAALSIRDVLARVETLEATNASLVERMEFLEEMLGFEERDRVDRYFCEMCGSGKERGKLLPKSGGKFVHETCIFGEDQ